MRLLSIGVLLSLSLVCVYAPLRLPFIGKKTKSDKKPNNNQQPYKSTDTKASSPQRRQPPTSSTGMRTGAAVNIESPPEMTKHHPQTSATAMMTDAAVKIKSPSPEMTKDTRDLLHYTTSYLPIDDLYQLYWAVTSLNEELAKFLQTKIENTFELYKTDNDLTLDPDIFDRHIDWKFHVWMKVKPENAEQPMSVREVASSTGISSNPHMLHGTIDKKDFIYYEPRVRMAVNNEFVGVTDDSFNVIFTFQNKVYITAARTVDAIKRMQHHENKWCSVRFPVVRSRSRYDWYIIPSRGDTKWLEVDLVELRMTNADAVNRKINRNDVRIDSRGDPLIWFNHGDPKDYERVTQTH